ncbi:MAG: GNAT family N-acetyltransferase [Planctomycetota bacterium]
MVPADYTIRVARSFEEARCFGAAWQQMAWHPDADRDFFATVLRVRSQVVRPHLIVLERAGTPQAMLLARVEDGPLVTKIGYQTIFRPRVRSMFVVYGGVMGDASDLHAELLVAELRSALKRGEADVAVLSRLRIDSPICRAARTQPAPLCRSRAVMPELHWRLHLPETMAEFLRSRSRNTRENVQRYSRRLVERYADRLTVREFRDVHELDELLGVVEAVARKTYQRGLGVGFGDTAEHRQLWQLALERGWLRVHALFLDGKPAAFWPGYAYHGSFFIGIPGYDPAYGELRVGQFLQMKMIEALCRDPAIEFVDYGFGDAQYKRSFATESWEEADVLFFAPTLRAVSVNLTRSTIRGVIGLGKRLLDKGQLSAKLKKLWRKRLSGAPKDG